MMQLKGKTLLIGYGNPGRLDDGLGPALVSRMRALSIDNVTVESEYQLAVEHAEQASRYDNVVFADAAVDGGEPFEFGSTEPNLTIAFSTHHVSPETILGLATNIFDSKVQGFTLAIRGYEFDDFGEQLSPAAEMNLMAAVEFLQSLLGAEQPIEGIKRQEVEL